jgi:hypothetical protein
LRLALHAWRDGVETTAGNRVAYDVETGQAFFGAASIEGRALVWELSDETAAKGELLGHDVTLDASCDWIMRCDRVDFPPGGVAYLHTHPGPGIRYLLRGRIEISALGESTTYEAGGAWFEAGPDPVRAAASPHDETSFVRVMVLPAEWEGARTIRYVDPADADRPKLQRATVLFDRRVAL